MKRGKISGEKEFWRKSTPPLSSSRTRMVSSGRIRNMRRSKAGLPPKWPGNAFKVIRSSGLNSTNSNGPVPTGFWAKRLPASRALLGRMPTISDSANEAEGSLRRKTTLCGVGVSMRASSLSPAALGEASEGSRMESKVYFTSDDVRAAPL